MMAVRPWDGTGPVEWVLETVDPAADVGAYPLLALDAAGRTLDQLLRCDGRRPEVCGRGASDTAGLSAGDRERGRIWGAGRNFRFVTAM